MISASARVEVVRMGKQCGEGRGGMPPRGSVAGIAALAFGNWNFDNGVENMYLGILICHPVVKAPRRARYTVSFSITAKRQ